MGVIIDNRLVQGTPLVFLTTNQIAEFSIQLMAHIARNTLKFHYVSFQSKIIFDQEVNSYGTKSGAL